MKQKKKIVALVINYDKKQLQALNEDICFASSIDDFEKQLTEDSLPVMSLGRTNQCYKRAVDVIKKHSKLIFYFLGRPDFNMTDRDFDIRGFENTEPLVITHDEVALLSLSPDMPHEMLRERRRSVL